MKRRDFIKNTAATAVLMSTHSVFSCANPDKTLKILVLGGTKFVGPAIVNAALENNHSVTLFNRGLTNPELFPNLRLVKGDREEGALAYESLKQEKWDVVIDVWPEHSRLVDGAAEALKDHTDHYIFISSIAVYNDFQEVGLHEESEVVSLPPGKKEWGYSEEKVAAERLVQDRFPQRHTILRPVAIKGWRDDARDLFYWCKKLHRDEAIIAPGSGLDPLQFIDVKDVGRFAVLAAENKFAGTFNLAGPREKPLLWTEFLEASKKHFNSATELIWTDEAFLRKNEVYSFSDLPLWAPLSEDRGFMQISNQKLVQTDFQFTPFTQTLDDCMSWLEKNGPVEIETGLERSRELRLLELLK